MSSYAGTVATGNSRNQYGDTCECNHRPDHHVTATDLPDNNSNHYYGEAQRIDDERSTRTELNQKLLTASEEGQLPRMMHLMRLGADFDYKDDQGFTAILRAAKSGQRDAVMKLRKRGADVYACDYQGKTIFNYMPALKKDIKENPLPRKLEISAVVKKEAGLQDLDQNVVPLRENARASSRNVVETRDIARSNSHATEPPWQYSKALGGDYVFRPSTDEIILRDGRKAKRPAGVPIAQLQNVIYEGMLPDAGPAIGKITKAALRNSQPSETQDKPPRQFSASLGGEFVYLPGADEIAVRFGKRFKRPQDVTQESLRAASYHGQL